MQFTQKSSHYLFIEALANRLRIDDLHTVAVKDEFYRLEAGLAGEKKLQQILSEYTFKHDAQIIYNFECKNEKGSTHQMDALILTPSFILILEVKQISGTLYYKPAQHEFYRIQDEGTQENFPNPFDQAYRHQLFLESQFTSWQLDIPILYTVVIANYRAKLDNSLQNFPIFHISGLPSFLENLNKRFPMKQANLSFIRSKLDALYFRLPPRRTVESSRLRRGVLCRDCNYSHVMHYVRGSWICTFCHSKSKRALNETLHHYRVLIKPEITNREFREFVGIDSKHATSKILMRLGLEKVGKKRGTYYIIPENILGED
ncbi:MAG: nuclease-related domain-containing protein [Solibacillus sp.]